MVLWFEALQQLCINPATTSLQGRCRVVVRSLQGRCRIFAGSSESIKKRPVFNDFGPCKGPATTLQRPCNGPTTTPLQGRCRVVVGSLYGRSRVVAGPLQGLKNQQKTISFWFFWAVQHPCNNLATSLQRPRDEPIARSLRACSSDPETPKNNKKQSFFNVF